MHINNPKEFLEYFREKYPDLGSKLTINDIRLMKDCKLICRYDYYIRDDLETAKNYLMYDQLRKNVTAKQDNVKKPASCKRCGELLPLGMKNKLGRPKEYCHKCQFHRNKERQRNYTRHHAGQSSIK